MRRDAFLVAAFVVGAAALRFSTLGVQSFDFDEIVTVWLVKMPFGSMLSHVPSSESTPPLYYVLAWGWTRAFGTGEVALRALSALFGTLTIPVAYQAARELAGRGPAVAAAALSATSPWLVWYSQQARAYSLVVFLAALSLLLTVRATRDPRPRFFCGFAITSGLALTAHYFAIFAIAPEAAWLIVATRGRRGSWAAVAAVAATGVALLPLALHQRAAGHGDTMIHQSGSLALRVAQVPKESLIGYDAPAESLLSVAAGLLALAGLVLLVSRATEAERRGAGVAAAVGLTAVGVPVLLALTGFDYVVARNVIVAWVPFAIALGVGYGGQRAGRAGLAAAALLCTLFVLVVVAVAGDGKLQRDDWRGAARALGRATAGRVIVLTPKAGAEPLAAVYIPGLGTLSSGGARVSEIDYVEIANTRLHPGQGRSLPRGVPFAVAQLGLREVARRYGDTFAVLRFASRRALRVTPGGILGDRLEPGVASAVLIQRPARRN